ncbi:cullin-9-like isoform X1 [Python bivittatus]|uniref:Cullin-9-like isoform X1 n=1 Tax=Python bivittatus TaxID=176946 RepID=A0A9F5INT0_PYTBI|nr:cullin-9-like isoform X1 [Python bivittatus]XP_025018752.1 cullin-9-like isoform X1 [Python bivittatus]XP_025018753.1 cullin-9-like isoform X1 [Python bivittatus]
MGIKKQNGDVLVHLGPKLQACPEELIRQRHGHNGCTEYLIRWNILCLDNGKGNNVEASSAEGKKQTILMWMSAEDIYANCPTLLGKRKPQEQLVEQNVSNVFPPEDTLDETSLVEMKADVRNLVQRASWQLASTPIPQLSILNTIHILNAYASIGSLMTIFKETGALTLLMKMLCNEEKHIRCSAGKMLRALACHDAGSRAYVLLSLSQQDGIEQHMDFDSRYTLLELFAETTSSEEHCISFEGIPLPQIPGKLLFSLVKRYLCATSLMDKLNNITEWGEEQEHFMPSSADSKRKKRMQYEFDFSMAMAHLISELIQVMGWNQNQELHSLRQKKQQLQSIFQPQISTCITIPSAAELPQKENSAFKLRSAFPSRNSYVEYMREKLVRGMHVRMLEDYEKVGAGDEGEFLQSNNGTPPVQVYWESLGRTYWVHWHMIEIVGSSRNAEQKAQEKVSSLRDLLKQNTVNQARYRKPLKGLYSVPCLTDHLNKDCGTLSQAEWWELLFFINKLELHKHQEVVHFIQQNQKLSRLNEEDLIQMSVSVELAQKILQLLNKHCQGTTQTDLQNSHVYFKYFFSKEGTEQNYPNVGMLSASYGDLSEAMKSKKPKEDILPDAVCSPTPFAAKESDRQLINKFLKIEGLFFPDILDEKVKAFCSMKVARKKSTLEQLEDAMEMIQKSSCDLELQMAGLKFITEILEEEEEPGQGKQIATAECEFAIREKIVKMLVDLLSHRVKEALLTVLGLQVLYMLMAKYDWQMLIATKGGLHCVLHCMKENPASALVQQAGLAVLKMLLDAESYKLPSACGKFQPLGNSGFQTMQEILVSTGSASSKDIGNLLCVIPAAVEKVLGTPGASAAVQDGLLVLSKLIDYDKSLAQQLGNSDLCCALRNFCHSGQSSDKNLAQNMLTHLSEHKPPLSKQNADSTAFFNLQDINITKLLSSLHTNSVWKEMALVLQRCLCDKGAFFEETSHEFLVNVLVLKDLTQQESEKETQLGMLRLLNKCLDSSWKDVVPWHKCIEPCLSSINSHINDREIVQEFIKFLHRLAILNKDCAVAMCCSGIKEPLAKVLEKHGSSLPQVTELRDLMNNCEKPASLYQKMTASILAGCIQMVLGQIEEHRHSHQPINVPFFDVFLHYLCHGCSTEVKEDKCWERVEVSSNSQQANKLVDGNAKTYWESNGSTGSHYINVYIHHGVIIQQMSLLVASEDSSYMPARIIVMAGESTSSISTKLNMVNVPSLSTRVILLENMTRFWPIIQIKIKRCQQGGIDTRVRGIEVLGPKPTFWPIFREQLCRRTHLFYATKARTWCQEISANQMQLLQLFNRLNSALCHEQLFASRFLPDDKAAQALGKTCWEALITPLVQRITSPDPSGISPMCWLLSQYLENLKAAQNATSQSIIFNSRVRRLSHLLVHVDPSGLEPEELKSPIKCNRKNAKNKELRSGAVKATVKKSTSLIGITQCWKDVVQQQVKQFLKSWQTPDFVEQYCSIYRRLRTAMEELFGQKTSFWLALCHGFSEGLLQLPFLTAVHVSEKFARYIDLWIRDSWTDSATVENVQHLRQNLEPIVFLAELELANIFEHFYRYYLGERLLSQGNTWLESAVVEHIGLCFPSRYPQQMLKNLSELEQRQQEFRLFQLQRLDKHLLEVDQHGRHKGEGEGEMMQEKSFSEEEEAEVKVLALSSFCWTISPLCYLKEPIRFFPSFLSQHLSKFADFYIQSQICLGLEQTKPPHLQWTWLGHAELEYQGCILQVSTLQMYILLCFNSAEEVSVETVLEVTGLSPVFLGHALKPLTKENGILTQRQSILRLNEEALGHVSGQCLWLLPKPMDLNVEEKVCHALEKKRNFICCLLIQILKEEKEIHIDSLVFKVIDAFHKQKCGSPSNFLRNVCSSADVLSCILYLLNQGFVQRQENLPQLLQYVSVDIPTTALPKNQPQVVFQTVQIKKVPSMPCMEKKQTFSTFR